MPALAAVPIPEIPSATAAAAAVPPCPARQGRATTATQRRAEVVTPLAPERYKLQVTLSRETYDKLRRAQALARHTLPDGDIGTILDRALTLLIDHLERSKFARVVSPRPSAGKRALPRGVICRRP